MPAAAKPTVVEALSAVMEEVQGIRKGDRNTQQGYMFRGVDAVVNAVGPALRKHGVIVLPISTVAESEHYTTAKGSPMKGVTLTVGFRFYGPAGDFLDAQVCGEASDSGDKATPKAHSVAYRTLLLEALCIPTDEPDPDSESHERAKFEVPAKAQRAAAANGAPTAEQKETAEKLAGITADLIAAGKITLEQVASAAKVEAADGKQLQEAFLRLEAKPAADLLARLQRYAEKTAAA